MTDADQVAAKILGEIARRRFAQHSEVGLQTSLAHVLLDAGLMVRCEVPLGTAGRIDLVAGVGEMMPTPAGPPSVTLCGLVGIEVKVAGSVDAVERQLARYAASGTVQRLVLVTTKATHRRIPSMICGIPVDVAVVRAPW